MKIILSRKGFDSAAGGVASPILPDGRMISLPIPDRSSTIRYAEITVHSLSLGGVVEQLTRGEKKAHYFAHLDPDLVADAIPRAPRWRPVFGQSGGEQSVLAREGVGPGDLFLFFGWFAEVQLMDGAMSFRKGAPNLHVVWGWMQVDSVVQIATGIVPGWAAYHPHVASPQGRRNNTLYVARECLTLNGVNTELPGAGVMPHYDEKLRLTKPGATRSIWSLPGWFAPGVDRPALGYHSDPSRWASDDDRVILRTVGRGQEFVLDTDYYPEALDWVRSILPG